MHQRTLEHLEHLELPMSSPIEQAIRQIVEEKGLSYESVMETIEAALGAAYRKDFGNRLQNIEAKFNPADASLRLWDVKTVVEDQELPEAAEVVEEMDEFKRPPRREDVEEVLDEGPRFNPKTEIMLSNAKALKADAQIGDVIRTDLDIPSEFGRMAAMTAKQVITQKLREAEREVTYNEYKEHEGEVLMGTVQRRQGRVLLVDLGRGTAIMRPEDQVPGERYYPNDRIRVYIASVDIGMRGPEILVSRAAPELVLELFKTEIPEIADGTVRIEAIAREPGSRSKVAVSCDDDSVDPIGACIGQRGARIQTIIGELGGEKVDIIEFDADPGLFVMNSLAPAKVESVALDEESKVANVTVGSDQLSLAIGKGG
ncbi:MAG: transcription termination factor NusA, partial [Patescibacteria group bacterium]